MNDDVPERLLDPRAVAPLTPDAALEHVRLHALAASDLLDKPDEPALDRLTAWAKTYFDVPASAISLISANRQSLKSAAGPANRETTRAQSFCQYVVQDRKPVVIEDASTHPRVADHPAVLGAPFVRAYAGAPLSTADGFVLGAFCVFDVKPRTFTPEQLGVLSALARVASGYVDLHESLARAAWTGPKPG